MDEPPFSGSRSAGTNDKSKQQDHDALDAEGEVEEEDFASASEGEGASDMADWTPKLEPTTARNPAHQNDQNNQDDENDDAGNQSPVKSGQEGGQSSSAWTAGWVNQFWQKTVSAVSESLAADVGDLMDTAQQLSVGLRKATETTMDSVYHTLDPEFAQQQQLLHLHQQSSSPQSNTQQNVANIDHEVTHKPAEDKASRSTTGTLPSAAILHTTETVLKAIDQTFDFTSDLLGTAVVSGVHQLERANLSKRLGELRTNVGSSEVLNQGRQVGRLVLDRGLTALEAIGSVVGKQAAETLAEARGKWVDARVRSSSRPHGRPAYSSSAGSHSLGPAEYFEENCGTAHLQALEMLATEAGIKCRSYDGSVQSTCGPILRRIQETMDFEEAMEEVEAPEDSGFAAADSFQQVANWLDYLGVANRAQLNRIRDSVLIFRAELDRHAAECVSDPEKVDTLLRSTIEPWSMKSTADYSEKCCEQILRIAEIFLMVIAEETLKRQSTDSETLDELQASDKVVEYASSVREIVLMMITELHFLTGAVSKLVAEVADKDPSNIKLAQLKSSSESRAEIEEGLASSWIYEAAQSLVPILKLMALSFARNQ